MDCDEEAWEVMDPALNSVFGYGAQAAGVAEHIRSGQWGVESVRNNLFDFISSWSSIIGELLEGKAIIFLKAMYLRCERACTHSLGTHAFIE